MSAKRFKSSNSAAIYVIIIVVIIVAFLLLGGGAWTRGMMHSGGLMRNGCPSLNIANWNWVTILISLGVGVLIGVLLKRRK